MKELNKIQIANISGGYFFATANNTFDDGDKPQNTLLDNNYQCGFEKWIHPIYKIVFEKIVPL